MGCFPFLRNIIMGPNFLDVGHLDTSLIILNFMINLTYHTYVIKLRWSQLNHLIKPKAGLLLLFFSFTIHDKESQIKLVSHWWYAHYIHNTIHYDINSFNSSICLTSSWLFCTLKFVVPWFVGNYWA